MSDRINDWLISVAFGQMTRHPKTQLRGGCQIVMSQKHQNPSPTIRSRRPHFRHILVLVVGTCAVVGICLGGVVWWQERPLRRATASLDDGDPQEALKTIDTFLRAYPGHGGAMSMRARALVAVGRPKAAIDLFQRVGSSNPKQMHAWAQALLQLERWNEALPVLEHLAKTTVDDADLLHELSACRAKVGDIDGAIAAAEEFTKQPGCAAKGYLLLGTIHNKRGNLKQAATAWGDLLKHSPDAEGLQIPPAEFFLEYGRVLQSSGHSRLAAERVERSLKLERHSEAFVALGDARSSLGDQEAAEKSYQEALDMEPGLSAARVGLAQLALAGGDAAAAKQWLSTLQAPAELTSQVAFLLQQVAARLGNTDEAKQWREKADKLRHDEQVRGTALQVLRDVPGSNWAQVLRAYQFAEAGNWAEAEVILKPIVSSATDQPFIKALGKAVRQRTTLPSLDLLPVKRF